MMQTGFCIELSSRSSNWLGLISSPIGFCILAVLTILSSSEQPDAICASSQCDLGIFLFHI